MRILAISHNFPHRDDPVCGIFAARQFLEMSRQGLDVTVMVPSAYAPRLLNRLERYKNFRYRDLVAHDGLDSFAVHFYRPPGKYFLLLDGAFACRASRSRVMQRHREKPFSMIYARGLWLEADIGLRLKKMLGVPVVGTAIGGDVNVLPEMSAKFRGKFMHTAQHLDLIFATGQGVADKIESSVGRKASVTGGVVDLDQFSPTGDKSADRRELSLPVDKQILLFAGHIIRSKGIYELVDAFEAVKAKFPQTLLYMGGEGEEASRLGRMIADRGLSESIILPGNIDPGKMHQWMRASDVFVLPSYREGMPNCVMEAMGCGLPVLTTAVGGLPAAIGDSGSAILVEPKQTAVLIEHLTRLLADEGLRVRLGQSARRLAEEKFCIRKNTERIIGKFKEVTCEHE